MMTTTARRRILSAAIRLDEYLSSIADQYQDHNFLGGAAQGCYMRIASLLGAYYQCQGRDLASVRVLDWGAGKGHNTYLMKQLGFNVSSCDVTPEKPDQPGARQQPIIHDHRLHIIPLRHPSRLPFGNDEFDLVVSFGVLEHVPDCRQSLTEIRRVLKQDGQFFFSFLPYWLSWTQRLAHFRGNRYHDTLYCKNGLKDLAEATGFTVESVWHGQLFPKNSLPHSNSLEKLDRILTEFTPLKYFATNLEGFLRAA